jgi:uncharacterized protein (DUF924 family)
VPSSSAFEVLDFWFSDRARALWFAADPALDQEIRSQFGWVVVAAANGALDHWTSVANGALALTILLDQFPRNLHRGSPRAFEHDDRARQVASAAIDGQFDLAVALDRRMFFYLPFEHSEVLADQDRSVELFTRWAAAHPPALQAYADDQLVYVHRHREIIQRFGRFPHRNAALGRASTADERAFLEEAGSSF